MCEFNRPYSFSDGHCMDGRRINAPVMPQPILPKTAWDKFEATLPEAQIEVIREVTDIAAGSGDDVHLYQKIGSHFVGIALRPGFGERVRMHVH